MTTTKTTAIDDAVLPAILIAALVLLAAPARAASDDCTGRIAAAWAKVGEVPAYRQVVVMAKQDMTLESVVIGNTIHSTVAGTTRRIELPAGGRKTLVERFAGATPTIACSVVGEERIDGRETVVYDFTRAPLPGLEKGPVRQTVWIGKADGLVRRLVGGETTVSVSYESIRAPR